MLGTHLRLERVRLGYSSKDLATKLNLTDSYLRLAESGRATLNQSLIFKIIQVYADATGATHDTRAISFPRLALFLVGVHWVGAEMAANGGEAVAATKALVERASDFEYFLKKTEGYFDLQEDSEAQKSFLEKVAAPEVAAFLRSDSYGSEELEAIRSNILAIQNDLLDLPTLNLHILLNLKQDLAGRSFVHTEEVAARWESQHAAQFSGVHGLFRTANLILNETNFALFHYDFLSKNTRSALRFIFIHGSGSSAQLKSNFVELLNAGRQKAPETTRLNALTLEEIDRISDSAPL